MIQFYLQDDEKENQKEEEAAEPELLTINPEYIYVAHAPKEDLVLGACRPESRKDCEVCRFTHVA